MKNSKKKRLLFEQGKRRYAVKEAFELYPYANRVIGRKERNNYSYRTMKLVWDGNRHPQMRIHP